MNLQTRACDPRRIAGFLDRRLSESEQAALEVHLSECAACRQSLHTQTADNELWDKASRYLRDDDGEAEPLSGMSECATECDVSHSVQQVLDSLGPTDDPEMLGRLGGYEVSGVVGSGGMGFVLKALDKSLDRIVAIKMMAPHLASNGAARKRFAREAKAAAAVLHPNVIAIHSVSGNGSLPYLVMPYLRGPSLQTRLDTDGPLPVNDILRIATQTAAGLAAAHAQGLVHRDIKPANILLEEGVERVAITDFGLARAVDDASMTRTGVVAGTPQYMSPEQARGESVDQRSDLFSLGSVMYTMCTGRAPFRAESSYSVLKLIADSEPRPIREINPDIPEWLCQVIGKLMSKGADERYQSADEVAELLESCLAHVQQPTDVSLPSALIPSPKRKPLVSFSHRSLGIISMVGALGVAVFVVIVSALSAAPDIAGRWTSEDWGEVTLVQQRPDRYEGAFAVTVTNEGSRRDVNWTHSGTMNLKWSQLERRFNGTWQVGDGVKGSISLRLVDGEIQGALTTSGSQQSLLGTPRLGDFRWTRRADQPSEAVSDHSQNSDKGLAADLALLQGSWTLDHGNQGNAPPDTRSIKTIDGNKETLQRFDIATGKLKGERNVEFTLSRAGGTRIFTFSPLAVHPRMGLRMSMKSMKQHSSRSRACSTVMTTPITSLDSVWFDGSASFRPQLQMLQL